jgi:hypothetical protein
MLKIFTICDPAIGEKAYADWIAANPGIKITTKHVCAHSAVVATTDRIAENHFDRLYIFYDTPGDAQFNKDKALIEQNAQFEMCLDIAKSLKGDANYKMLSNKSQRQLYLLDVYRLPRDDAEVVDTILQMDKLGVLDAKPVPQE